MNEGALIHKLLTYGDIPVMLWILRELYRIKAKVSCLEGKVTVLVEFQGGETENGKDNVDL